MARKFRLGSLLSHAADSAVAGAAQGASRTRGFFRDVINGRFTCACCPGREFRGHKAMNAHHLARHGGYWAGKKAQATGRKIGKQRDAMRKHARGYREAYGHIDRNGRLTDKGRSRPELRGRLRLRDLREAHRHGRHHDRADNLDRKAGRHETRGTGKAPAHRARAESLRARWQAARPVAVPAREHSNGRSPEHSRTSLNGSERSRTPANGRTR